MEVTDQFIENIKEMLKESEKNLVNFPLKDLPEKQVIFAEMLTNPGIREVLKEDEWNSFKDKALVGLVKRLCNLKEVPQDDIQREVISTMNILLCFMSSSLASSEPDITIISAMQSLFDEK